MTDQIARFRADQDAMGHMLYDSYQHPDEEIFEIIERDDGYIDAGSDPGYYFRPFAGWPAYQQASAQAAPEGRLLGRVLDLGCGAGRVALYYQEQGCVVVGIDVSPLAVEVCRLRGVKDARVLSVTQVGPELGRFDRIVMAGCNWGLTSNPRRARWLLKRFHAITEPGAIIIAESNDVYKTTLPMHLAYQAWNRERGRMSGQIRMRVMYQIYRSPWIDYLMVSKAELEEIIAGTGWQVREYYDQEGATTYAAVLVRD